MAMLSVEASSAGPRRYRAATPTTASSRTIATSTVLRLDRNAQQSAEARTTNPAASGYSRPLEGRPPGAAGRGEDGGSPGSVIGWLKATPGPHQDSIKSCGGGVTRRAGRPSIGAHGNTTGARSGDRNSDAHRPNPARAGGRAAGPPGPLGRPPPGADPVPRLGGPGRG